MTDELPNDVKLKKISNLKTFVTKSTSNTKRFNLKIFYCVSTCIYVKINVVISNVTDQTPVGAFLLN